MSQGRLQPRCGVRPQCGPNRGLDSGAAFQKHNRVVSKLCQDGQLKEALQIVEWNVQQGIWASLKTLSYLLRGCIRMKALTEGKRVHALIMKSGFESNIFLGNSLVNLYAECGSVLDARSVFNKMPKCNVFSWTAVISAYAKQGQPEEALNLFQQMQRAGVVPDEVVFVVVLKACASLGALERGKQIHAQIMKSSIESNAILETTLVNMYMKCRSIDDARQVFNKMLKRNVVSWNAMIAGCAQEGHGEEAFTLFEQMQQEGMKPDNITFVSILKACASVAALDQGKQVHAQIIQSGLESDVFVGNSLVDMYAKCGSIQEARQVFNKMCERNVVSWTAIIAGYAQQGFGKEALILFEQMQQEGMKPNMVTFVCILKACASLAALEWGKRVHAQIIQSGLELMTIVESSLVDMYAKCGSIEDAHYVFSQMRERDVVSWTAMIAGYAQQGHGKEAVELFEQMQQEGMKPDRVTFISVLKACTILGALEYGKQVHAQIIQAGLDSDVFVESSLVDMYGKCGSIEDARQVFNKMCERNIVSWNTMIAGYAQQGHGKKALTLFEQMQQEGMKPDVVTFVCVLKACSSLAALEYGKQVHAKIVRSGLELKVVVENSLVDMYWKCGSMEDAWKVFNKMLERDVVSWNVMIAGCAQQGYGKEALMLFERMQWEGMKPDKVTFVSILKTCANLAALEWGKKVHAQVIKSGLELNVVMENSLIDMYGKCGSIEDAHRVFNKMRERDVISWNSMIGGYAQMGKGKEALTLFEEMQREGMKPDLVTFVCVLSACSRAGLVNEGFCVFDSISQVHGITPTLEHYCCMVDLLGRAGRLLEAEDFIYKMPVQPDAVVWMTLLGACRIHGNMELGVRAFQCVTKLEPKCAAAYVLLSNIFAIAGKWNEVAKIRKEMETNGVKKEPGCSWIEVHGKVHAFLVGGRTHPQSKEIQAELKRLIEIMKLAGYVPDLSFVLQDMGDKKKEYALCDHSEKLAIGFGLISSPPRTPIRIKKNLRVCGDCHNATKIISKVVAREIIARDANRFHHFKDGVCSCGDYW